ncbi:MAG: hypothetical protein HQ488_03605 [Parcubacteria group bacterium]|nr:hypothetical protein [Parcubacteria group bacterium]
MAMELTHVRFAHDLKDRLDVKDLSAYYAGSIYPDSRYLTGIARNKTHGESSPHDPFVEGLSDFEKGWATHLLYDRLGHICYFNLSPYDKSEGVQGNHVWQYLSAQKVVEDMFGYDLEPLAVDAILNIRFLECPNAETAEQMEKYLSIQKRLYKQKPTFDDYKIFWNTLSINRDVCEPLFKFVKSIFQDDVMVDQIKNIYPSILDEVLMR